MVRNLLSIVMIVLLASCSKHKTVSSFDMSIFVKSGLAKSVKQIDEVPKKIQKPLNVLFLTFGDTTSNFTGRFGEIHEDNVEFLGNDHPILGVYKGVVNAKNGDENAYMILVSGWLVTVFNARDDIKAINPTCTNMIQIMATDDSKYPMIKMFIE